MTNKDSAKAITWEFKWNVKKFIENLVNEKKPEFTPRKEFKEKLDAKIQDKIRITKEQKADQATMDAVPRKLKWRFYLTGYGYAVISFLVLFLIWFCTNIFTWTLKVPTKYTYLDESKAFGDLAYGYGKDIASNYAYYDNTDTDYESEETMDMDDDAITDTNKSINDINSPTRNFAKTEWQTATISSAEMSLTDVWWNENFNTFSIFWLNNFMYNQTYRFAYKDKIFPRLSEEYPIYKATWILMWSNTPNQVLKNLKIWDVSFKKFQDLEIAGLYIEQNTKNWYSISFDSNSQTLNFYPNDSRKAQKYNNKIPSKKQIIKAVEKELKQLGVSIKDYWDGEVDTENHDENMWIINIFYPLKFQWKETRDMETEEKIWMNIAYDLNLQKVVSIIWIDIATYDISNYPILDKAYIENKIENGWAYYNQWALHENSTVVLFDNMEIIYILKYKNWTKYYIPAIKWEVSTKLENYNWPKYVVQEITQ